MKITLAATVTALTVLGVVLARTTREPHASGLSGAGPVDAPPSGGLRAASGALAAPLEGNGPTQAQGGARLPRSEPGSSDGVDDELANAEAVLWGRTRLDVQAAREALANEDLYPARQYLAAALAERWIWP